MNTFSVNDLEQNSVLDSAALAAVKGGVSNVSAPAVQKMWSTWRILQTSVSSGGYSAGGATVFVDKYMQTAERFRVTQRTVRTMVASLPARRKF